VAVTLAVVVRHGETAWSASGRHTGRTDVPLTDAGRQAAIALRDRMPADPSLVLASPLSRAVETCRLAGAGRLMQVDKDLREWDYGAYEGRTTAQIRQDRPGWSMWSDGCPRGETAADVGARADRVIARLLAADGVAVLVAHGHILRVLAARWIGLEPPAGALLALGTGTLSMLGWEREQRVIQRWNS
jgi:probable phosphoglycerate mutase